MSALGNLSAEGTPVILIGVYGNRDYEDALVEGQDILKDAGFNVIAAGAFVGEHSYSEKVGTGRPDHLDIKAAKDFAKSIAMKLSKNDLSVPFIKGKRPYRDPMPNMPFTPKTTEVCDNCGMCRIVCPMQVINKSNPFKVESGCILCSACVKVCPNSAKYIDAEPILKIVKMLESKFVARNEPELFI